MIALSNMLDVAKNPLAPDEIAGNSAFFGWDTTDTSYLINNSIIKQ